MSNDAQIAFEQGKKYLHEEMKAEAINAFQKAISLNQNISEYHAYYAVLPQVEMEL